MTADVAPAGAPPRRPPADVTGRLTVLEQAIDVADGRLDASAVADGRAVLFRAGERLRLSGDHTVVAVAGATGSGKSSLFNAVTGLELAAVGVRRPTTASALACVWGDEGAKPLLEWLGIPSRHQLNHESPLDEKADTELSGLVLLDLPDHDSTEVSHQVEVDRLVQMVDLLVWVVDPQKYADRVLHERYLQGLTAHRGVVVVVLNRVDQLSPPEVEACRADLEGLLSADGLDDVRVLTTSAVTGHGIEEFRTLLSETVAHKRAMADRLVGDTVRCAERLAAQCGEARVPQIDPSTKEELVDAFAHAGGVPIVADAVGRSYRDRAAHAAGWPPARWVGRLRRDPLGRLHARLRKRAQGAEAVDAAKIRASLPEPTPVQRARVDTATRNVVDSAVQGLTQPWVAAIHAAARSREAELGDALDQAIVGTDLGVAQRPGWWGTARAVQHVLLLLTVAGAAWLAAWLVTETMSTGLAVPAPTWSQLPLPAVLLVLGVVLGILTAAVCGSAARKGARRRADAARARMVQAIDGVARRLVFQPIEDELEAYRGCRDALATLRRS